MSLPLSIAQMPEPAIAASLPPLQGRLIPLDKIAPSPTNPRKTFPNNASFKELVANIKLNGVTQAILVRPSKKGFELIVGERRWRASQQADRKEIPAIVRDLTDEQVCLIQLDENEHREGVHPLEQAQGYKNLMAFNYSAEEIAKRTGHDVDFIRDRLLLLKLGHDGQKVFLQDKITMGHALQIARLPEEQQGIAVKFCFIRTTQWNRDEQKNIDSDSLITVASLRSRIQLEIMLNMKHVTWDKDDPNLVKEAGSCTACPKRTGSNAQLFDDLPKGEDRCLDRNCFQAKASAQFVQIEKKIEKDTGKAPVRIYESYVSKAAPKSLEHHQYSVVKPNSCTKAVTGIILDGSNQGKTKTICFDDKCKVHRGSGGHSSPRSSGGSVDFWAQRAQTLPKKIRMEVRRAHMRALYKAIEKGHIVKLATGTNVTMPAELLQVLLETIMPPHRLPDELAEAWNGDALPKEERAGPDAYISSLAKAKKPLGLQTAAAVMAVALNETVKEWCGTEHPRLLVKACGVLKVDAAKIDRDLTKQMTDEFNARRKKSEAKKKAAEAKSAPPKKAKAKRK